MRDLARLEALEDRLAKLTMQLADARREIAEVRASVSGAPTASAPHAEPPREPPREPRFGPPPPPPPPAIDLEKVVGRYGVLALAVLMIVMGAGALVSWALARGLIGPWVRVSLGLLLALGLATAGFLIRQKSNRWFGDALLAVSLAVVHVVAWGMGPALHLVPSSVALILADLASITLCWFALHEDIEELFSFGIFGALAAPFVTSTGEERYLALAVYGIAVIAGGLRAGSARRAYPPWRSVAILLAVGTAAYALALSGGAGHATLLERTLVASFAGAVTILAMLLEQAPTRPLVAVVGVSAMTLGLFTADAWSYHTAYNLVGAAPEVVLLAATAATLSMYLSRQLPNPAQSALWVWLAVVLPMLALLTIPLLGDAPDGALQATADLTNGAIALLWALGYWFMSRREAGESRTILVVAAGVVSAMAVLLFTRHVPGLLVPSLAAHAVLFGYLARREAEPRILAASAISLLSGFALGVEHFLDRPWYVAPAFLTLPSLECASVVIGAYIAVRLGAADRMQLLGAPRTREQLALGSAFVLAFVWGRAELGQMISHDVATFAIILYYAVVGILLIWRGRRIGAPLLRHAGLGLAVWAALTALGRAADVQEILLRVGSYLGVGAFLLGVAWWYRADSAPATDAG